MQLPEILKEIESYIKKNDPAIILLKGELGAGKTHLTQELADIFKATKQVTSPTFTFLQKYDINYNGFTQLVHCDFYRTAPTDAEKILEQVGFWDFLTKGTILVIEWPERLQGLLTSVQTLTINISIDSTNNSRNYTIYA